MTQGKWPIFLMVIVVALGSSGMVATKQLLLTMDRWSILIIRFNCAAVILVPLFWYDIKKHLSWPLVCSAVVSGVPLAVGSIFLVMGIELVPAGYAAFIISLEIALVPLICFASSREPISARVVVGIAICVVGLFFFTWPTTSGARLSFANITLLASALSFAFFTIANSYSAPKFKASVFGIVQLWTVGIISTVVGVWYDDSIGDSFPVTWSMLYLILIATALRYCLQVYLQKGISAIATSMVFSLEPLFAACLEFLLFGILFSHQQLVGCSLILGGILLSGRCIPQCNFGAATCRLSSRNPRLNNC